MNNRPIFITGIGTDIGKTIVSAVLTEQMKADYWKPVQAGDLHYTDSDKIRQMISNPVSIVHPETFRFEMAASPHKAAKAEGTEIRSEDFKLPHSRNQLLIEGAGGLFVPLSNDLMMIDLIKQFNAETVLVARNYLGCINHVLLSFHALTSKNIMLRHLIFNGDFDMETQNILLHHLPKGSTWSHLPEFTALSKIDIASAPLQILV